MFLFGQIAIYLLFELQVNREMQKLLLSDTFVPAQTFSVDELLVTPPCMRRKSHSTHQSVSSDRARKAVSTEAMQTSTTSALAAFKHPQPPVVA